MATALDEGLAEVCRFLRESAGFEPDALGMQSVAHAVRQRMAEAGAESSRDYLRRLQTEAGELQDLLDQVVVPETWFVSGNCVRRAAELSVL
jgi:chemotaxis protein methyltransferase WspC